MLRFDRTVSPRRLRFGLVLGLAALTLGLAVPVAAQVDLTGTYRIQVVGNGKFIHHDGCCSLLVTTIWQPDDDFTRFVLERQDDGSYRIRDKATGRYLHDNGLGDRFLTTRYQPDDDFTRFYFEQRANGSYRIRVKATNRYLHDDGYGDQRLSTRIDDLHPNDPFGHFRLVQEGGPHCDPTATSICLNKGRFRASIEFKARDGQTKPAQVVRSRADDSGLFWFFNQRNWEMLIKVLNACSLDGHYWVFYAATTNVEFTLTVEDTETGEIRRYSNPAGTTAQPVTDTTAFATCP